MSRQALLCLAGVAAAVVFPLLAPNYLVVDATGFLPRPDFADQTSIAVPNCKLRDRGCLRNRKQIRSFHHRVSIVAEDLLNVSRRDLYLDLGVDLDRRNRQGPR